MCEGADSCVSSPRRALPWTGVHPLTVALAALGLIGAGCSASGGTNGPQRAVTTFTCCTGRDVNRVYHPGDTMTIHWIKDTGRTGTHGQSAYMLKAELDGSFQGVVQAKAPHALGVHTASAHLIQVSPALADTATPVSRIRIAVDATPGLYNLTTTVIDGGSRESGTTIIRVARN